MQGLVLKEKKIILLYLSHLAGIDIIVQFIWKKEKIIWSNLIDISPVAEPAPEFWGGKWATRKKLGGAKVKNVREARRKICTFWAQNALKYAVLKLKLVHVVWNWRKSRENLLF